MTKREAAEELRNLDRLFEQFEREGSYECSKLALALARRRREALIMAAEELEGDA